MTVKFHLFILSMDKWEDGRDFAFTCSRDKAGGLPGEGGLQPRARSVRGFLQRVVRVPGTGLSAHPRLAEGSCLPGVFQFC